MLLLHGRCQFHLSFRFPGSATDRVTDMDCNRRRLGDGATKCISHNFRGQRRN